MSKKKKDKKKESEKPKPLEKPEVKEESEDPFDFGGLPQRDLKKNLGCG